MLVKIVISFAINCVFSIFIIDTDKSFRSSINNSFDYAILHWIIIMVTIKHAYYVDHTIFTVQYKFNIYDCMLTKMNVT